VKKWTAEIRSGRQESRASSGFVSSILADRARVSLVVAGG